MKEECVAERISISKLKGFGGESVNSAAAVKVFEENEFAMSLLIRQTHP